MKPFNEENLKEWDFKTGQHLHGDVIVTKIDSLPEGFSKMKEEPKDALAYGEHTGHLHKLFRYDGEGSDLPGFSLRVDNDGVKFLKVDAPIVVKHQEHSPRVIPSGLYKIGIQVEHDPFAKISRQVAD